MKYNEYLEQVAADPRITSNGVDKDQLAEILNVCSEHFVDALMKSPTVAIGPIGWAEVISLKPRRHVLRGVSYGTNVRYRLKLTINEEVHDKLKGYFDQFKEDS